ncbi:unnamed protein product [Linum trigynum]|uniref:RNase H type-1 domain-containing protein n=1 Tax=Linum trigynum TaxID=586398 RepID=A0AAV2EQC8_9ROSI
MRQSSVMEGLVARGSNGQFLMAANKRLRGSWVVEEAEAIAAEFGVQLVKQHNLMNPILETDSLGLVSKIDDAKQIESEIGVVCRSIRRYLEESGLGSWQHIHREGNMTPHCMADSKSRWDERVVWVDSPPSFLVNQLVLDNVATYTG